MRKSPISKAFLAFKQKKEDSIFVSKIESSYGGAEGFWAPDPSHGLSSPATDVREGSRWWFKVILETK